MEIIPGDVVSPNTYEKIVQLQAIIKSEDKTSYLNSLKGGEGYRYTLSLRSLLLKDLHTSGRHPLLRYHSDAVYQKSMCRLLEYGTHPLKRVLNDKLEQTKRKVNSQGIPPFRDDSFSVGCSGGRKSQVASESETMTFASHLLYPYVTILHRVGMI